MDGASKVSARIAQADRELWVELTEALADLPGNPYGAEVRTFDEATALLVHSIPLPYYNRVFGCGRGSAGALSQIVEFYRERFSPCRIDHAPLDDDPATLDGLARLHFRPAGFQTNLYAAPELVKSNGSSRSLRIHRVTRDGFDLFGNLYVAAYKSDERPPRRLTEFRVDALRARLGRKGWTFYVAFCDGRPAGGAILYVANGVATLAGGATLPEFRGRGCQTALLQRRMNDAARSGCDLIVSRCTVGSTSQRNMERVGLRTAYTKVIWQQPDLPLTSRGIGRRPRRRLTAA
jgi:GNAT superfamily N-acetyltransferase